MKQNFIPHVASRREREGELAGLKGSLLPQKKKKKKRRKETSGWTLVQHTAV
jgi:hypothetical protein